jgi:hypothetical protein
MDTISMLSESLLFKDAVSESITNSGEESEPFSIGSGAVSD